MIVVLFQWGQRETRGIKRKEERETKVEQVEDASLFSQMMMMIAGGWFLIVKKKMFVVFVVLQLVEIS